MGFSVFTKTLGSRLKREPHGIRFANDGIYDVVNDRTVGRSAINAITRRNDNRDYAFRKRTRILHRITMQLENNLKSSSRLCYKTVIKYD